MAMTAEQVRQRAMDDAPPKVSEFKRFMRIFLSRKVVMFGLVVILGLLFVAITAPWIAPYDPYATNLRNILQPPSSAHWLGTDNVGRDTLSRLIYGSRTSLTVGLVAVAISATIGMTLGVVAGYFGGWTQTIIMRIMDASMSIPTIMFAVTISALLGGGLRNVIIALGIGLIPTYARLMCGQVLTVKQRDFITASKSIGSGSIRIMLSHVVPNCFPPLIVMMTMQLGTAILSEASLSFLGIGIKPPEAAWGSMVSESYQYLQRNAVLSIAPGLALMLVVFAFNMVGDGLRDALDPKLRGSL
jgi:ABC-type dipeptide/oligopeptide/nickel transport system permease subunit